MIIPFPNERLKPGQYAEMYFWLTAPNGEPHIVTGVQPSVWMALDNGPLVQLADDYCVAQGDRYRVRIPQALIGGADVAAVLVHAQPHAFDVTHVFEFAGETESRT